MQPTMPTAYEMAQRLQQAERRIEMLERLVLAMPSPSSRSITGPEPAYAARPNTVQSPDGNWIPVYHRMDRNSPDFPPPCNDVGVYLTRRIHEGERCSRELLRICPPGESVWRAPTLHDEPRCQSCQSLIDPFSSADLDYLSVMQPAPVLGERQRVGENRPDSPPGVGGFEGSPELGPVPVPPPPFAVSPMTPEARDATQDEIDALRALADDILG